MAISIQNRQKKPNVQTKTVRRIARTICDALDSTGADLSVVLTSDDQIRELNREWRGKDRATDVLSFSQIEGEGPAARRVLGDVVISLDTAARQAAELGHDLEHEVSRLLVHGVLHLLGYDHERGGAAARRMEAEEKRLWELLGIGE
jgi:probable rRNA maturation factor